jgi:Concanavalin A-like lectin/glucanases superfamily
VRRLGVVLVVGCSLILASCVRADYRFHDTYTSSVGTPPALQAVTEPGKCCNFFATDTVDGSQRRVLVVAEGNGVKLQPTTDVVPSDVYTVAMLFKFLPSSLSYDRILQTKSDNNEMGWYRTPQGNLQFWNFSPVGQAVIPDNTYVQVVVTRDAEGNVSGYVNGTEQATFVDTTNQATIGGAHGLIFIDDDGNEEAGAVVARIRLWDRALTPQQVADLDRVGTTGDSGSDATELAFAS